MRTLPAFIVVCAAAVAGALGALGALQMVGPAERPAVVPVHEDDTETAERLLGAEARVHTLLAQVDRLQESLSQTRESLQSGQYDPVDRATDAPASVVGVPTPAVVGESEAGPAPGTPEFDREFARLYAEYQDKLRREQRARETERWRGYREDHGKRVVANLQERLALNPAQSQAIEGLIAVRGRRVEYVTAQRHEAEDREEDFDFWTPYNESTKVLTDGIRAELSSQQQATYDDLLQRGGYRGLGGRNRGNR